MTNLFFQEAQEFEMLLDNTAIMVHKLKEASKEFGSVTTESSPMKEIKGCMENDMDQVGEMAHIMKEKLSKMIGNNAEKGKAIDSSSMSLTIALKTKLKERKGDLENLRQTIRQEHLEDIQRRAFTVTGIKLSDEAIRVIDTGSIVQMCENALRGKSPEQMVAAVDEIKERHAVATDFDKKILELQQNFEEMAALIETQEKIDNAAKNEVKKIDKDPAKTKKKIDKELKKEVKKAVNDVRSSFQELYHELEENGNDSDCRCLLRISMRRCGQDF